MTNTTNTQYWICTVFYEGSMPQSENVLRTGYITTAPIYSEEELEYVEWQCDQRGPFNTMAEAREAMTKIFSPCRKADYCYINDSYKPIVKERWDLLRYHILTDEQAREVFDYIPFADTTDDEIKAEAASSLFWRHHLEFEHYNLEKLEKIFFERRERAREGFLEWQELLESIGATPCPINY